MKLRILWVLSTLWAVFFFWTARDLFGDAWTAEGSLFNIFTTGRKPMNLLASVGAITVGSLPLVTTYGIHRFHKSREHGRLTRERKRIDRRIDKIEAKRKPPTGDSPAASMDSSASLD